MQIAAIAAGVYNKIKTIRFRTNCRKIKKKHLRMTVLHTFSLIKQYPLFIKKVTTIERTRSTDVTDFFPYLILRKMVIAFNSSPPF